jgi:flagellar basal-body rod protein FlgB
LDGIADVTMQATQYALSGLAQRGDARANNIANVNTPSFRSKGVSFESALSTALDKGGVPADTQISTFDKGGSPNSQGNTVSLETEMTEGIKDSLTYESMVNGFNYKVSVLRQAIGGKP